MLFRNILLIDDDEDDQEIFLTALENIRLPVNCTVSDNARDALDKLVAGEISPELIILDLNMPVMNGQQFLMEVKKEKNLKNIPVIVLSTSSHELTIALTKELGASQFISKPERFEDLISQLRKILGE
ncbi:MAG: response regulator [Bacteroidota bacterium]